MGKKRRTKAIFMQFAERQDKSQVEQGLELAPKFDSQGLIPCVATDHQSGDILMVAFMNEEALQKTIEIGEAVYYSRSRQEMWHKGATSGHTQKVIEMRVDCDQDCIWLKVDQQGAGACHVGYTSCFYRKVDGVGQESDGKVQLSLTEADKAYDPSAVYGKK